MVKFNFLKRCYFINLGLVLIICCTNTLANGQGISVSPSRIFFKGQPGQTVTQTVTLINNSNGEFNFISTVKDWDRDSLGVKIYYPSAALERSNGEWLSLSESSFKIAAGETKSIIVSMTIPVENTIKDMTNSMLFFTQIKEQVSQAGRTGIGINVLLEIGIQVYHEPANLVGGDLEFLAFTDEGYNVKGTDSVRTMGVKIKNNGQINKDAYVRFELTDIENGSEIPLKSIPVAMLPEAKQWIYIDLPAKLKGRYLIVAILDAGSQYNLKVAEKEIQY